MKLGMYNTIIIGGISVISLYASDTLETLRTPPDTVVFTNILVNKDVYIKGNLTVDGLIINESGGFGNVSVVSPFVTDDRIITTDFVRGSRSIKQSSIVLTGTNNISLII
jgi:hypothetical protein